MALVNTIRVTADSFGIKMNPASRLARFEQQLKRMGLMTFAQLRSPEFDFDSFTEGNRDVSEIAFICATLAQRFPNEIADDLRTLLGGPVLPTESVKTVSRDRQFEYYTAAGFAFSGFDILLEEPDVRFEHEGTQYGIAAKRVSSPFQLEKRVREGIEQLEKEGLRGIVALSMDRLLPRDILPVSASSPANLDAIGEVLLKEILRIYIPGLVPLFARPNIVGLLITLVVTATMAGTAGDIGAITLRRMVSVREDTDELTKSIWGRWRDRSTDPLSSL